MLSLFCATACAAAFRLRGDAIWNEWTGTGTTGGRFLWAGVVSLCLFAAGAGWWSLAALPVVFACAVPGWPASIDLGRNEGTWQKDFALMTVRGALFTVPAGALLVWQVGPQFIPFALSGVFAGAAYELGWRLPIKWEYLRQGPPFGEFCFGFVVGFFIGIGA